MLAQVVLLLVYGPPVTSTTSLATFSQSSSVAAR